MWTYQNARWQFKVTFPDGWREYGFMRRLFSGYNPAQPQFTGPNGADVKFAVGPISPIPSVQEMQRNLEVIAQRHGHWVLDISSITVGGKEHATMVYHIPLERPQPVTDPTSRWRGYMTGRTLRVKNFHIIIGGIEFVVTGKIALFDGPIGHVGGQPIQDIATLFAHNEDYDDIVRTIRTIGL